MSRQHFEIDNSDEERVIALPSLVTEKPSFPDLLAPDTVVYRDREVAPGSSNGRLSASLRKTIGLGHIPDSNGDAIEPRHSIEPRDEDSSIVHEPCEPFPGIKRQHNIESVDGDVAFSMARRKKNARPETKRYHCSHEKCDRTLPRQCDLAKHEKTHLRPFKCPEKSCRYHEQGLPSEKQRDRHV